MNTILKKTLIAALLLAGVSAGHAAFSQVTIRVTNNGNNVQGERVVLFEGKTGKCDCIGGNCTPAPDFAGVTDKNGQVTFPTKQRGKPDTLKPETDYVVCINPRCGGVTPCQSANNCQFGGGPCKSFKTNKQGKYQQIEIIKP
jgi:hypothetical protein